MISQRWHSAVFRSRERGGWCSSPSGIFWVLLASPFKSHTMEGWRQPPVALYRRGAGFPPPPPPFHIGVKRGVLLESGRRVPRRLACMHARIKRHHEGASDVQSHFGFPMTDVAQFASTGQILRSQTYYRAVPRRARPVGSHPVCLGAFSIGGTRGRRATAPQS